MKDRWENFAHASFCTENYSYTRKETLKEKIKGTDTEVKKEIVSCEKSQKNAACTAKS